MPISLEYAKWRLFRYASNDNTTDATTSNVFSNVTTNDTTTTTAAAAAAADNNDVRSLSSRSFKAPLVVNEGGKRYIFDHLCSPTEHVHMPKLRKIQVGVLKELFNFETENCVNDSICGKEYRDYKEQQQRNASLSSLGLIDHLVYLLGEDICYDNFLDQLWNWKPKEETLQFIEFKWCEAEYKSTKSLYLNTSDYDGRATDAAKNIDTLGYLKTQNNIELVVVESSSKYGIQVIKTKVVLSKTSMVNKDKWKYVQVSTAQIPTTWNDRLLFLEYLELLATIYVNVKEV
ncbi:hypothetical protein INT45_008290 [Circinella minor]|uniref:Uncharacterized protein n=1 Tax=Circinella minor TaxID=1195481 RepID=A0A8H7S4N0_9FUNG|nr:hypothetical protein INT45_008290 [Circinella minor]